MVTFAARQRRMHSQPLLFERDRDGQEELRIPAQTIENIQGHWRMPHNLPTPA